MLTSYLQKILALFICIILSYLKPTPVLELSINFLYQNNPRKTYRYPFHSLWKKEMAICFKDEGCHGRLRDSLLGGIRDVFVKTFVSLLYAR